MKQLKFFFFQTANQVGVYILFVIPVSVIPVTRKQKQYLRNKYVDYVKYGE